MPLTDTSIRSAKPKDKTFRLFDSGGLYLEINPAGGKWWRWKYRVGGKEKRLSLGVYPDVSLKFAREKRDTARRQLAKGIDPGHARKAEKLAQAGAESFRGRRPRVACEVLARMGGKSRRSHPAPAGERPVPLAGQAVHVGNQSTRIVGRAATDRKPGGTGNRSQGDAELRAGFPLRCGNRPCGPRSDR